MRPTYDSDTATFPQTIRDFLDANLPADWERIGADLPIYLATLGPKSLEITGEIADGWIGTSLVVEHADVLLDPIRRGAENAGRSLADIDLQANTQLEVSDDVDELINRYRPAMAFTLGAMGSARTNFNNSAFSRAGFGDVAAEVQRLRVDGDKPAEIAAVPDQLVLAAYAIGTDDMVTERIRSLAAAGVDAVRLGPIGRIRAEQRTHLEMAIDLVRRATAPAEEEMRSAAVGVSRTPIPRRLSRLPRRR